MKNRANRDKSKSEKASQHQIKIIATVHHVTRDESFYRTGFRTVDGVKKTKLIGREQFRRPTTVVDVLLKAHAALPDDGKEAVRLVEAAVHERSSRKYRLEPDRLVRRLIRLSHRDVR